MYFNWRKIIRINISIPPEFDIRNWTWEIQSYHLLDGESLTITPQTTIFVPGIWETVKRVLGFTGISELYYPWIPLMEYYLME